MTTRTDYRSMARTHFAPTLACVLMTALLLTVSGTPAQAANYDLTGDNVNINLDASWYNTGSGGGTRRGAIGIEMTGLNAYLNTTYTNGTGRPQPTEYWNIWDGHLDLQSGAAFNMSGSADMKITHASDANAATITLQPGASFTHANTNDSFGLFIGYNHTRGTFIVNNGGTIGSATDIALGGNVAGNNGNTSNSVGVFKVIGDGGTIGADDFRVSRYSEVMFELDNTGISTINVGGPLQIWDDGGNPAGNLIVDTSALVGQHTVNLFTYGSLSGTFGNVQILGSELTPGNGLDPMTYSLNYAGGTVSLTYNNVLPVPEPQTFMLAAVGVLGIVGLTIRRRR